MTRGRSRSNGDQTVRGLSGSKTMNRHPLASVSLHVHAPLVRFLHAISAIGLMGGDGVFARLAPAPAGFSGSAMIRGAMAGSRRGCSCRLCKPQHLRPRVTTQRPPRKMPRPAVRPPRTTPRPTCTVPLPTPLAAVAVPCTAPFTGFGLAVAGMASAAVTRTKRAKVRMARAPADGDQIAKPERGRPGSRIPVAPWLRSSGRVRA